MSAPDILSVVLRAGSFVLLLQAAGVAIFLTVFGRRLSVSSDAIRRLGRVSAVAAMVFVAGQFALEGARMTGDLAGAIDPSMQMIALRSSTGAAFVARMAGLMLVAAALRGGRTSARATDRASVMRTVLALMGGVLAVTSFTLTGHTSVDPHRPLLAALLLLHLLVVVFWFGALAPLYLASLRESAVIAGQIVQAFSVLAVWLVPCILLAGVALAVLLIPAVAVLAQPYGELLLTKAVLFAVLLALGALNKWRFGPEVGRGDMAAATFRRALVIEYILICAVLAVTAVMTAFYSPEPA